MIELAMLFSQSLSLLVSSCTSSISSFLTAPYTTWFPIVILAVLAVISILSIIYAVGPLIGSMSAIRPWVKVKIYELLLAIILIMIFASIATGLCDYNPVRLYNNAGLVSNQCSSGSGNNTSSNSSVNNIYSLAMCNMYAFNGHVENFNDYMYFLLVSYSVIPNLLVSVQLNGAGTAITSLGASGAQISADLGPLQLSPITNANRFENYIIPVIYTFLLLNQIQLILLAASPYLFALFMAIGLIARAFGATRTFGGAMIAFGLGIGFIYPVLISLNYGFVDYALEHTLTGISTLGLALPVSPLLTYSTAIIGYLSGSSILNYVPEELFIYAGLIVVGVVFINLLNFVILDAFISDFSTAVGEKMDFLSLLTNII